MVVDPSAQSPVIRPDTTAVTPDAVPGVSWRSWGMTVGVVGFVALAYLDKAILGLVAAPMMAELGLNAAQFGLIASAAGLLGPIGAIGYAFVARRVPVKAGLIALVIVWTLLQLPVVFAASLTVLLVTRLLLSLTTGPAQSLSHAAAYSWFPNERRGLPAAAVTTGASFAKLLVAPLLAWVVAAHGWQAGFGATVVLGAVWVLVWGVWGKDGPYQDVSAGVLPDEGAVPMRRLLATPTFIGASMGLFACGFLATIVFTWLPSYFVAALGFSQIVAGSLFGLPSVVAVIGLFAIGWFSDRQFVRGASSRSARGLPGAIVLALGGLLLAILPLAHGVALPLALVMIGYGLAMANNATAIPAVAEIAPAGQRTALLSWQAGIATIGGFLGPWVTGVLVDAAPDRATGFTQAFAVGGLVAVAFGIAYGLLVDPQRDALKLRQFAR